MKHKVYQGQMQMNLEDGEGNVITSYVEQWWEAKCGVCGDTLNAQLWKDTIEALEEHFNMYHRINEKVTKDFQKHIDFLNRQMHMALDVQKSFPPFWG